MQAAGIDKTPRIHDLRHSHASWLIAAGVPLPAIQRRLGHESITTTIDRYGHLAPEMDDTIVAALSQPADALEPVR
jgi:integrase